MTTLRELGWIDGQNLRIELRWSAGDLERMDRPCEGLVAPTLDVIVAMTNQMVEAVHTKSTPYDISPPART